MANRRRGNARSYQRNPTNVRRDRNGIQPKPKLSDARQRILSKKGKTVRDARDILSNKAKTQDARRKILKLREFKKGEKSTGSVRAISTNILQKTDRNGKISLITSKNKQGQSDMNLAIQQQLGLITQARRKPPIRKEREPHVATPQIRKSVLSDYAPPSLPMLLEAYKDYLTPGRYRMERRVHREDWAPYVPQMPRGYVDLDAPEDEEMPLVASPFKQTILMHGTSRSSNVRSRLDSSPSRPHSHGILSHSTKTKVVVPVGHRIVVSNLQEGVTQDDIRELFEDIGQLLVARLVRPGTAEVIFKNLKDAQRAVDTYHNRQLDGQPMKCLLVNKRPFNNPIAPALSVTKVQSGSGLSRSASKKLPQHRSTSEKLVPDLQTIHKVLFQRN